MLVDGNWTRAWDPYQRSDDAGRFIRQRSSFRNWITPDGRPGPTGEGGFAAEPDRYHLYVALICPWASRTLMVRALQGLEDMISVTVVEPDLSGEEGWRFGDFPGASPDPLEGAQHVHELYTHSDPHYTGRATVPILWDKQRRTIVNNESADIIRMLGTVFEPWAKTPRDLYPEPLRAEIDVLAQQLYVSLNNGVYRAGFAQEQAAHEEAVVEVFTMLDALELRLGDGRRFLFGDALTEADVRLFVTLARFDAAYYSLFKCNLRRLADYSRLSRYLERVLALRGVRSTVNLAHIKAGYYSIRALNPTGIVPLGPTLAW